MLSPKTISSEPAQQAQRLVQVQDKLRAALDDAPHLRALLEEWIELRFSTKERLCQSH